MARNDADILIIGASPAGIMAARSAAQKGASVILIDRKEDIGDPPHPADTFFKFMLDRSHEHVHNDYVVNKLRGMKIISPAGTTMKIKTPGFFIDRQKFDRYYRDELVRTGVDIRTGVEALAVIQSALGPATSTSEGIIRSALVIAADGIESKIAARMGIMTTWFPRDVAWAVEAQVRAEGIGQPDMFEYYLGSHSPGWKSTYSPAGGDIATLGVYVRRRGRDVQGFFERWLLRFSKIKGYDPDDIEIISTHRGGDPIATVPHRFVTDGFMVTGGAAGQSGIGYGMRAGQICGEVAAAAISEGDVSAKRLKEYSKRWRKEFAIEYWLGRIGLEAVRKMTDAEIDTLVSAFADQDMSFLKGPPLVQVMRAGLFVAMHKPTALRTYRALLRRK